MSANDTLYPQIPISEHRKHPCVLCQRRKVKCDRNEPCANCNNAGVECVPASTLPPRKRKRRFPEAELLTRLQRYERHLRRYGADIDAINHEGSHDGEYSALTTGAIIKSNHSETPEIAQACKKIILTVLVLGVNDEFRAAEELLEGSSDDEMWAHPVTKTYEELGGDGDDLLFGPQTTEKLTTLHPSPVLIFRLWQTFLDNINPLIKIFHAPSVQQKVLDATANLETIPKNTEALMFGIYAVATLSMNREECLKLFNESKDVVLARFQSGARRALRIAGYLRSSDIVVLQAFALYLLSDDNRSAVTFCLTGVAVRIAQRMGLAIDGSNYAIPPFEAEMRRRLWWQLILIENRVAELSSGGICVLAYAWNTKLPANVNDSDLFPT
ncbi:hypothetical protein V1517DRAFT_362119 [Lipomyces orientalis]|uniref:Uncharacterized protein n=1 Tax=Lipomyces orientalis TaxID=1233043 RepID=A0ACC3TLG5_9ASCO